jgi:hypothetical protein
MQREGEGTVVRQGYRIVTLLVVLIVALLYLAPAYGRAGEEQTSQIPGHILGTAYRGRQCRNAGYRAGCVSRARQRELPSRPARRL